MQLDEADTGPILDLQFGIGLMLLTVAFFELVNVLVQILPLPKTVAQKPVDEFRVFRWRNLLVSWLHGCITGTSCMACLYFYKDSMWEDMMQWHNLPAYLVCAFSAGYFLYDSVDIIRAGRMLEKWEILVHHSAIVIAALYPLASLQAIGYHVLSMSIEMNTAFLHSRTILLMSGFPRNSIPVQVAIALNILSFILFRFVPLYYCTEAIFLHWSKVPLWFATLFTCSMIVLNVINVILFWRILRTDFFRDSTHLNRRYFGGVEMEKEGKETTQINGLRPIEHRGSDRKTEHRRSQNLCDSLDLDEEAKLPGASTDASSSTTVRRNVSDQQPATGTGLRGSVIRDVDEQIVQLSRSLNLRM